MHTLLASRPNVDAPRRDMTRRARCERGLTIYARFGSARSRGLRAYYGHTETHGHTDKSSITVCEDHHFIKKTDV